MVDAGSYYVYNKNYFMIEFINTTKKYKNSTLALDNINLKIGDGDFIFLVGPSGAGKSTLLKLLIREERPSSGSLIVDEVDITKLPNRKLPTLRRNVGMIFQDFKLLLKKTVWENVAFTLEVCGERGESIKEKTNEVLGLVGLTDRANLYPNQISGGEAQRTAIARAAVLNPKVLLADEPTGNLDPQNAKEVMSLLDKLNKLGTTIIMATHKEEYINDKKHITVKILGGKVI